jgi:hypothetical protein
MVDPPPPIETNLGASSNSDLDLCIILQQSAEEYPILHQVIWRILLLTLVGSVPGDAAGRPSRDRGRAVPVLHLVSGDGERQAFVPSDVVGEKIPPGIVRHTVYVDFRSGRNLRGSADRADVMGFAEIVPCDDSAIYEYWMVGGRRSTYSTNSGLTSKVCAHLSAQISSPLQIQSLPSLAL